jgi:phosphopantetheinyl transferase
VARDGQRYAAARTFLRHVLARHVGIAPESIAFTYSAAGKPAVPGIRFNLAHCEGLFVVAVADVPVGIDIERLGAVRAPLATRILTPRELRHWRRVGPSERRFALTSAWVRKEACAKALGTGVRDDIMRSEVGIGPSPGFRQVRDRPVAVAALDSFPGHTGAVAVVFPVPRDVSLHLIEEDAQSLGSWRRAPRTSVGSD